MYCKLIYQLHSLNLAVALNFRPYLGYIIIIMCFLQVSRINYT